MKLLFTFSLLGLLFNLGCSTHNGSAKTGLNAEERRQLDNMIANHEFYSGCVTEEIADLKESVCDTQNQCNQSHSDNKVNEQDFTDQLNYQTWLKIYKACIANPL